jgi:hypothetical protein
MYCGRFKLATVDEDDDSMYCDRFELAGGGEEKDDDERWCRQ